MLFRDAILEESQFLLSILSNLRVRGEGGHSPIQTLVRLIFCFEKVPYLNSSLFEPTGIEHGTLFISNLRDDKTIPIYSSTVLKSESGKKRTGNLNSKISGSVNRELVMCVCTTDVPLKPEVM